MDTKTSKKSKEFLKGIGIILLFYSFPVFFQLTFYSIINISNNYASSLMLLLGEIILLLIMLYLNKGKIKGSFKDFKENKKEYIDIMIKYYILGYILLIVSNISINIFLNSGISDNEALARSYLFEHPLYYIPSACLISPIIEELTFKVSFKNAFEKKWLFILFTTLLFAAVHTATGFSNIKDLIYIIPYSTIAFSFSYAYAKTNNPLSNIIIHIFHNTTTVLLYLIIL